MNQSDNSKTKGLVKAYANGGDQTLRCLPQQRCGGGKVSKKEYIERGAFIDFVDAGHLRYATEKVFSENDLVKMISEQPAADVEPVVRGEWVHLKNNVVGNSFNCTICNHEEISHKAINPRGNGCCVADENGNFYQKPKAKFCPNCGAHMIGAGNVDK